MYIIKPHFDYCPIQKTHYFISNQYWKSNYELVKEMMLQSDRKSTRLNSSHAR